MTINQNEKFAATCCAIAFGFFSTESAVAAGFYLHEHSANGLGRSFAGQAAKPENASILATNPAAMNELSGRQISIFASYIEPGIDFEGAVTLTTPSGSVDVDASQKDISDSAIIPALFFSQSINADWSAGLAVFSNFGLSTDFNDDFNALHFADRAEIKTLVVNPSIALEISESLAVGFGINAIRAEAELGTSVPQIISGLTDGNIPSNAAIVKMEGDDWGIGWNVGLFIQPFDTTHIGLSYRASTTFTLSGEMTSDLQTSLNDSGTLELELPAIAEFAIDQQLTNHMSLQFSANWFEWSTFDVLNAQLDNGIDVLIGEERFENTWKLSVGSTFQLSNQWTLRAGYAYDEGAATSEHRSLNIPDTDREWLSIGATYTLDNVLNVDFGLLKVIGREVRLEEHSALGRFSSSLVGVQNSSATIVSAQLNYIF